MPINLASLTQAMTTASDRYTKLVLLVGPKGSGKTELLRAYAQKTGTPYIPAGGPIAERLLATPSRFRDTEAGNALAELCPGPGPFLLDNLELLFDPSLKLDTYRLLTGLARTKTVVAAWPGSFQDGALTYASPGHREHRSFPAPEAECLSL